ncbi:hypothetical protein EGI15_03140 [Chryseobacterium cucumeris]|uniref:Uncharacterized protein n=1 Tax=Chryseobacterium cucumeris TaxID=1813611 RepID=A0ABX9X9B9_9FLAO|nr:hypothetical protein [Chryseobacterium sediminis]ROH94868.1 hypothetical protein EGI15_03140 [Chryseobacterium cucumeris]
MNIKGPTKKNLHYKVEMIHSLAYFIPTSLQCKLNFYTMKKTAIIILSDPKSGSEEAFIKTHL